MTFRPLNERSAAALYIFTVFSEVKAIYFSRAFLLFLCFVVLGTRADEPL